MTSSPRTGAALSLGWRASFFGTAMSYCSLASFPNLNPCSFHTFGRVLSDPARASAIVPVSSQPEEETLATRLSVDHALEEHDKPTSQGEDEPQGEEREAHRVLELVAFLDDLQRGAVHVELALMRATGEVEAPLDADHIPRFSVASVTCDLGRLRFRERNAKGDWVGGPMYSIKNGLGKNWLWLAYVFAFFGMIASFGIGNTTQVDSIATAINTAVVSFGGAETGMPFRIVIGLLVAVSVAVIIIGGIKRIGAVTEKLVPFMALIYIIATLIIVFANIGQLGTVLAAIFQGAFSPRSIAGGALGVGIMTTIQKGIARGVFSNEAGLGSAPIAHAATSLTDPVKQGLYGIFEVFMDSIVICTLTSLALLMGLSGQVGIDGIEWGVSHGSEMVVTAFSGIFGGKLSSLIIAVGLSLFALSTILSWSLYGTRCCEFLFGKAAKPASLVYKVLFCVVLVIGSTLGLDLVWTIGDALNGLMALPNLIALLLLSGTVISTTKEFFSNRKNLDD